MNAEKEPAPAAEPQPAKEAATQPAPAAEKEPAPAVEKAPEKPAAPIAGPLGMILRFLEDAAKGGGIGAVAMAIGFALLIGWHDRSGHGRGVDMLLEALVVGLLVVLGAVAARALQKPIRELPLQGFLIIAGALAAASAYGISKGGLPLTGPQLAQLTLTFVGLRFVPWQLPAGFLGAVAAMALRNQITVGEWPLAAPLIYAQTLVGALAGAGLKRASKNKAAFAFVAGAVVIEVALIGWLRSPGIDNHLVKVEAVTIAPAPPSDLADPSARGPFVVTQILYGSGTDIRRKEYGPGVAIKTEPVDASMMTHFIDGWHASVRESYWGFDNTRFPRNARVWLPQGPGPFPLVLVVHGNYSMAEDSDAGYDYFTEPLASRGFIVVSVDENFLNRSWAGNFGGKEVPARGWMLLKHLELWKAWNDLEGSPFKGKVDLDKVGLVGHSRGGAAVHYAASIINNGELGTLPKGAEIALGRKFTFKAVATLAASKMVPIDNADYLSIHGAHDSEAATFFGALQYEKMKFYDDRYHFKAYVYINRGNHHLFNTHWGTEDAEAPLLWLLNQKPVNPAADQEKATLLHLSAFFEASLHEKRAYTGLFRDHRVALPWLPKDLYVTRFEDTTFKVVADYEEDKDGTTTTLKGGKIRYNGLSGNYEAPLLFRLPGTPMVSKVAQLSFEGLGKDTPGSPGYTLDLPDGAPDAMKLTKDSRITFSIAVEEETSPAIDLTVELKTKDGVVGKMPLSAIFPVPPPFWSTLWKWRWFYNFGTNRPSERILQSYSMKIGDFATKAGDGAFDISKLQSITFRFDKTGSGTVVLDRIGFEEVTP